MPSACAATPGRDWSKVFIAVKKPVPGLPSMFSLGTRQSWKISSRVAEARMPILSSFLPKVKPWVPFSTTKQETPRGAAVGVGDGEDGVDVGLAAVGDPLLGAVDDVVVAVLDRAGLHARDVGAGVGLGQAERGQLVPSAISRQPLLLLLFACRR